MMLMGILRMYAQDIYRIFCWGEGGGKFCSVKKRQTNDILGVI